jgi:dTDP-4-dehydrorhamnose reductase
MLGQELARQVGLRVRDGATGDLMAWDVEELDIADAAAVADALGGMRPAWVINSAAYTDVDGCEANAETAMSVNGGGPGHLADACRDVGAGLVHFSTDFVFDGRSDRPYREEDPVHPLSMYGRSKLEGERAVASSGCRHLVVRTSWLFGLGGRNFVEAIAARAQRGEGLRVVTDQVGRPTLTVDLAEAVIRLLDADAEGLFQFANAGSCSWHEFAEAIVEGVGASVPVDRIVSSELGRPAERPAYSVLDTSKYAQATGHEPATWQEALSRYLLMRGSRRPEEG